MRIVTISTLAFAICGERKGKTSKTVPSNTSTNRPMFPAAQGNPDNGNPSLSDNQVLANATEDLVQKLKELQRTDWAGKEQWGQYCDLHGGGVRDPTKHPSEFLQTFFTQYKSGVRIEPSAAPMPADARALIDLFKHRQRTSACWNQAWACYCQTYGGGVNDPAKHDHSFLIGFLDFLGMQGLRTFANGSGGGGGRMGASSGDAAKDELVLRIKSYQRSSMVNKEAWWKLCDEQLDGVRDPNRHDASVLKHFVDMYSIP